MKFGRQQKRRYVSLEFARTWIAALRERFNMDDTHRMPACGSVLPRFSPRWGSLCTECWTEYFVTDEC